MTGKRHGHLLHHLPTRFVISYSSLNYIHYLIVDVYDKIIYLPNLLIDRSNLDNSFC